MCFQQRFVLVLTAFRRFWYKYICFDPNYRMVVVASISNVACLADFGYSIFSSSSLLRPFIVHYWNMQSRGNQLLCETSERDYKLQHWIEMLALLRQNTIMPLSGLLHRIRRFYDFCLNIGWFAIEKRVKQKFSPWILLPVITKYVQLVVWIWVVTEVVYTIDFVTCTRSGVSSTLLKIWREI